MEIAVFSSKPYDREFLNAAAGGRHAVRYIEARLAADTAVLARGARGVCVFVNDTVDGPVLRQLRTMGVDIVALRAAGYNNVDLDAARREGIAVAHVPAYSPEAVAEHTVALILSLDRNIHRAHARVREGHFELDGLLGFNLHGRTVGIVGTGRIGTCVARIMIGFGCKVLAFDVAHNADCTALGVEYVPLPALLATSDIVTLHCPLTPGTHHMINTASIEQMKHGVMLINTSRGGIVDTEAVVDAIKSGAIGHLGLDVYEEESTLFFEDKSNEVIRDDVFERLLTFPNVLITGHQAFFTREAMTAIAETTMANLAAFERNGVPLHVAGSQVALPTPRPASPIDVHEPVLSLGVPT
jgi:D-lactate dehydrogenase